MHFTPSVSHYALTGYLTSGVVRREINWRLTKTYKKLRKFNDVFNDLKVPAPITTTYGKLNILLRKD